MECVVHFDDPLLVEVLEALRTPGGKSISEGSWQVAKGTVIANDGSGTDPTSGADPTSPCSGHQPSPASMCGGSGTDAASPCGGAGSSSSSTHTEDGPSCWICLGGTEVAPLERPCLCPRLAHQTCRARWQLQSCGRDEERCCRFCSVELPDWKGAHAELPKALPIM